MENYQIVLVYLAGFTVIALASKQIGHFFVKVKMPLISGFLFAGMLAGPYVLGLIPAGVLRASRGLPLGWWWRLLS